MNSDVLTFLIFCFASICVPSLVANASEQTHVPHIGFYELKLYKRAPSSTISNIQGRLVAEWSHSCHGWSSKQKMVLIMKDLSGKKINSQVNANSFESLDGKIYKFFSKSIVGGKVIEVVRGKVKRAARGMPGIATYELPLNKTIKLPGKTMFPYEHTLSIIDSGKIGTRQKSGYYFDGSQPNISPKKSTLIILGKARAPSEGLGIGLGKITERKWWRVRLALFSKNKNKISPEFEMTQDIQDNGVVRKFIFDYRNFSMTATLIKIQELDQASC